MHGLTYYTAHFCKALTLLSASLLFYGCSSTHHLMNSGTVNTKQGRLINDTNILLEEKLLDGEVATWSDWQTPNKIHKLAVFLTTSEEGRVCRYYYTQLVIGGYEHPRVYGKSCRHRKNSWEPVNWYESKAKTKKLTISDIIRSRYYEIKNLNKDAPKPKYVAKSHIPSRLLKRAKQAESEYKLPFRNMIEKESSKQKLNPALIHAVVYQESYYKPHAVSHAGAIGLMQLMPGTAKDLRVNPRNPYQNINGGTRYLKQQLRKPGIKGNIPLALAAYNAGYGNVRKYGYKVPPYKETRNYVKKIMHLYKSK